MKTKNMVILILMCSLCFGQIRTTLTALEERAEKYGIDNSDNFFSHDDRYLSLKTNPSKKIHILDNIDKYKVFVNIEVINILEKKAANRKKKDFALFVANKEGEPDISAERVRNFRETGYYIDEYEKYVDK